LIKLASMVLLSALILNGCGPATMDPTPAPTPKPDNEVSPLPDAERARDQALTYLAEAYGDRAPAANLSWTKENVSPEGMVGATTFRYTAQDWVVTVNYPVVAPEATLYRVIVAHQTSSFQWEGEIDARGQVQEIEGPDQAPVTPIEIRDADVAELIEGNSAFAFDLYELLRAEGGNLFYSPHSICLALAMTYGGARGETEAQMADALDFRLPPERLHPAFRVLSAELALRSAGPTGEEGEGFQLHIVNALWGQKGFEFLHPFLDLVAENYGAGLKRLDFASDPEEARLTINDWVADQTEDRIEDLIAPGLIDGLTRLVLTNAIYFNAAWAHPFSAEGTQDGPFHRLDGSQATVPMMAQTTSFLYGEGDGYQAVELPYIGGQVVMLILLPQAGEFEAFEDSLDEGLVEAAVTRLGYRQVALTMPRFEYESQFSLKDTLTELGMPVAFTGGADFSGMTGDQELFISEVVHKAYVSVDEEGTEAAAATAVLMPLSAAPEEPVLFNVDRPFVFLIRDVETGAILFLGRVVDPAP
jgi:serpin B